MKLNKSTIIEKMTRLLSRIQKGFISINDKLTMIGCFLDFLKRCRFEEDSVAETFKIYHSGWIAGGLHIIPQATTAQDQI